MDMHFPDYRYEKLVAPKTHSAHKRLSDCQFQPEKRHKLQLWVSFLLSTPLVTTTLQATACLFVSERKRAWPVHLGNGQTDGKSLRFGLVSDQLAINQRAGEQEACSEGHRWEDKWSERTKWINSWPWVSAQRWPNGVMKRCLLHRRCSVNWNILMKVPSNYGMLFLLSYIK